MKKLVLTIALVALLVAAVFGGQALASSKSNDISISEETSSILGSSYWGYPVRMKTLSGDVTISSGTGGIEENYPGVRHVSLTLSVVGIDTQEEVAVLEVFFDDTTLPLASFTNNNNGGTYEFDAERWWISAYNVGGNPIEIRYHATITYPSNQW
jgi:hypothetical protein